MSPKFRSRLPKMNLPFTKRMRLIFFHCTYSAIALDSLINYPQGLAPRSFVRPLNPTLHKPARTDRHGAQGNPLFRIETSRDSITESRKRDVARAVHIVLI